MSSSFRPLLDRLMEIVQNPQATLADLAAMLLSNLTTSASTCAALLSMKISVIADKSSSVSIYPTQSRSGTCAAPVPYPAGDELKVDALPLLLDAFVRGANAELIVEKEKRGQKGELHFLSSVFANLSTVRFLLFLKGHRLKNLTFFVDVRWSHVLLDTTISGCLVAWRLLGVSFVETCRLHGAQGYYPSRGCYFDLEVRFAKTLYNHSNCVKFLRSETVRFTSKDTKPSCFPIPNLYLFLLRPKRHQESKHYHIYYYPLLDPRNLT